MKRILIIAYIFPPSGGAGVQRTTKFVNYLPDYNWLPIVLTVTPSNYGVTDISHMQGLSNKVEIIRSFFFDPIARYSSSVSPIYDVGNFSESSFLKRLENHIKLLLRSIAVKGWVFIEKYFLIPDQAVLWIPFALVAGMLAAWRSNYDIIYATGEPYSSFITARILSKLTGVPYVIDMRDPWTLSTYRKEQRPGWRESIERWMEKQVLAACSACIFANPSMDLYANLFSKWSNKFHYLPNGFDSLDFEGVNPKRFDKFTIIHTGTFLPGYRTADTFLLGLRSLLNIQPELAEQMQVILVGKIGEERHLIAELNLQGVVFQTGYVPHRESMSYLLGADALLLVGGEHSWEETGKIYEYMAAGKPIIALSNPTGAAAQLLNKYSNAMIVDRECVESTKQSLVNLVLKANKSEMNLNDAWIAQYDRKRLTKNLANILNDCILP